MTNKTSRSPLKEKSFQLSVEIVKLSNELIKNKVFVLGRQILRSGTNPGAMVREAQYAQSGRDFIHKLEIAQKELNETIYWLELLFASSLIEKNAYRKILSLTLEVKRMITKSIITRKRNLNRS